MKRVVAIFLIILCATSAYSGTIFRGLGKRLNVYCLGAMNSSGVFATGGPDSADISAYRDDGSSAITVYRKFTSLANMVASSGWFDTTNNGGYKDVVMTVYVDSVAGTTPTGTMVTVKVKLYTSNVPTETNFNVYVSSGLNNAMAAFDGTGGVNLKIDSLIGKRIGIYNTVASTTTNDYGAVEFSTTGDSSFAFVVKNTGIAGAKFKGSAFKLYSKTHSGILSIAGATGSPTSGGVYFLDSSANGYGQYVRSTSSGYGATYTDDGTSYVTTLGPIGGDIVTDWITATALRREACQKIAQNILKDTTKRIGFKGGLGDSVLTPAPTVTVGDVTLAAGQFTKIKDTVARIINDSNVMLATDTGNMAGQYTKIKDSIGLTAVRLLKIDSLTGAFKTLDTIQDTIHAVHVDVNLAKDSAGLAYRTAKESVDTLKNQDDWVAKEASVTKVRDSISKLHFNGDSVVAIDPIRTVVLTTPAPTLKQIRDTLIRAADTARIHVNDSGHVLIDDQWTDAQRDSIVARVLANRDTAHSLHLAIDTVRDTANADIALDRLQATAANLIKVIDSVNAILDTLQNNGSSLRVDTCSGGGGEGSCDLTDVLDSLGKSLDSIYAILDTLQNLSSTLRLAGSDLDTVYQTVLCNDTIGGDFLLTLADYRAQIKRKFGVEITNTTWQPDSVLNQLIREAIVTVNPIIRGAKTTKTFVSRFDSSDYPLDSLVGIGSVLWYKDDTARSIPYLAREKWATLAVQNTYGGVDAYLERPQVYDYTDAVISFFPVPTSEDSIKIYGWNKIPNITVVSSVATIPQKYRVAILKYATFLVARAKQHPLIQTFLDEYKESVSFLLMGNNVQVPVK